MPILRGSAANVSLLSIQTGDGQQEAHTPMLHQLHGNSWPFGRLVQVEILVRHGCTSAKFGSRVRTTPSRTELIAADRRSTAHQVHSRNGCWPRHIQEIHRLECVLILDVCATLQSPPACLRGYQAGLCLPTMPLPAIVFANCSFRPPHAGLTVSEPGSRGPQKSESHGFEVTFITVSSGVSSRGSRASGTFRH